MANTNATEKRKNEATDTVTEMEWTTGQRIKDANMEDIADDGVI